MVYKRKHEPIRSIGEWTWKSKQKKVASKTTQVKKKLPTISKIEKKLDAIFSRFIRLRDALKTTWTTTDLICYTCGKFTPVKDWHNMHFISRRFKRLRWSEVNCRGWCYACNVMLHGNYIVYTRKMQEDNWIEFVDELIRLSKEIYKADREWIKERTEYYEQEVLKLSK